ncbi:MAG: hypothetical protein MZV63_46830 [Marinilabiliales bacterium]|nr:hypothetical protein [Marinilabiliales bacterium]
MGHYAKPENLGAAVNGPGYDHSPFIAPMEAIVIFSKIGSARKNRQSLHQLPQTRRRLDPGSGDEQRDGLSEPEHVPWVTPDGKYLCLSSGHSPARTRPSGLRPDSSEDLRKAALLPSASDND